MGDTHATNYLLEQDRPSPLKHSYVLIQMCLCFWAMQGGAFW
jgi:hypothetical protein